MAIVSDGKGVWEEPEAAALEQPNPQTDTGFTPYTNISPTATGYGEARSFYWPDEMLLRRATRSAYADTDWFRDFLAGNAAAYGSTITADDLHEPTPIIQPDAANQKYAPPGQKLFDQPLPEGLAQELGKEKAQQIQADSNIQRYENNHGLLNRLAVGAVADLMDPINASTLFIPGVGEEAFAARFGESFLGRTLARGAAGATLGVAQQAPVEFMKYQLGQSENDDYGIRRALADTLNAAVFTAIPTMGFGAVGDLLRKVTGEVHTPPADKPVVDQTAPVVTADLATKDAATRTATAQLVEGKPVDVDAFFPKPPATMTAIGQFMDHPFLSHVVGESEDVDRDALARQLEPDLFGRYDDLATRRGNLASWYQDLSGKRDAAEQAAQSELADLQDRLPRARQRNLQKQIAARIAELQTQRTPLGVASPADLNLVQQQMMDADYRMREMAQPVSDAYQRADEMIARLALARTGEQLEAIEQRQRQFATPYLRPNFAGMIQREAAWRQAGVAPGISYSDLAQARGEVEDAAKQPPPETPPTKAPDDFGKPVAEEEAPIATGAQELAKAAPAEPAQPAAPAVDTTGWLPEEKAELEAAQAAQEKAGLMAQAFEQAASCLAAAAEG